MCLGYDPLFAHTSDRRGKKAKLAVSQADTTFQESASASESTSNGSDDTTSGSLPVEVKNKMTISSLIDAAAVIECSNKRKFSDAEAGSSKKQCLNLEDTSCDKWDMVEVNFTKHVASFLDALLATSRFSSMPILNMAKSSGLPLDGNGTAVIPSTGVCVGKTLQKPDGPDASTVVSIGQNIATLEAVRQLLSVLCPNFYLDNLVIDETSVSKLEELRSSDDYRLLRAVVQLVTSSKNTQLLPVAERDHTLMLRLRALYKFMHCDPAVAAATSPPVNLGYEEVAPMTQAKLSVASNTALWTMLLRIASGHLLTPAEEDAVVGFALSCPHSHSMRVPFLLGVHHYLQARISHKAVAAGRDSTLRLALLEACSSSSTNVVLRRLIGMTLD